MPIETKTLGVLIDELMTTNMKMFKIQDELPLKSDETAGALAKKLQSMNKRRNELIAAIDRKFGDGKDSPTEKTYT
jgi:hypothetical protein